VVWTGLGEPVFGHAQFCSRGEFLQRRLPVQTGPSLGRCRKQRVEQAMDHLTGNDDTVLEIHRSQDGFERVGEDRGLVATPGALLTSAETDTVPHSDAACDVGQGPSIHDRRANLRQLSLGIVHPIAVERIGDDEPEHGVTEELQALVGGQPAVLVGEGAVGQCEIEQLIGQRHPERLLQPLLGGGSRGGGRLAHAALTRGGRCPPPS
jgi:hypothetical protein